MLVVVVVVVVVVRLDARVLRPTQLCLGHWGAPAGLQQLQGAAAFALRGAESLNFRDPKLYTGILLPVGSAAECYFAQTTVQEFRTSGVVVRRGAAKR